jgi:hypothetical protein
VILASVALPRPDARAAPRRQGSACSLRNGNFSNGLNDWIVNNPDVTLDNAEGNPAPSVRFYRPSSAYQLRQDVYIPPGTTWVEFSGEFRTNSCEYEGACSGGWLEFQDSQGRRLYRGSFVAGMAVGKAAGWTWMNSRSGPGRQSNSILRVKTSEVSPIF